MKCVHSRALHFIIRILRDPFFCSRTFSPRSWDLLCGFSLGYDEPCQIRPRHDSDRLVWERRKLFSCSGQKESSNPITSYLTGDKMDGIRDPPPPGNSSSYFCLFFHTSFLFSSLFSLSSSIFIGLELRILIWRGVLSWGVIFLCCKGWKEEYVGNWNFACHTIL